MHKVRVILMEICHKVKVKHFKDLTFFNIFPIVRNTNVLIFTQHLKRTI